MEIWAPIQSENGLFSISNFGNLKNNKTQRNLAITIGKTGYKQVATKIGGRAGRNRLFKIHRELAIAFLPNPDNLPQVNHKDGDKLNNSLDNLEWCTAQYNTQHAVSHGLLVNAKGHEHPQSKLSKEDREFILNNYSRYNKNYTGRALAERFGVDKMQIYRTIKRGY
jgi:hypothetical protein